MLTLVSCSGLERVPAKDKNDSYPNCSPTTAESREVELYWRIANGEKVKNKLEDLCIVEVMAIRPTQFAVGMMEVKRKLEKYTPLSKDEKNKYLKKNPEPIVIGPRGEFFIIDHHHLARTLYEAGTEKTYGIILENWYGQNEAKFWSYMNDKKWIYLYDENGNQKTIYDLFAIKNVSQMKDDPYRSIAGQTRCKEESKCLPGQWLKSEGIPFIEFKWAEVFRKNANIRAALLKYGESEFDKVVLVAQEEVKKLGGKLP